jgi:hypothetical protein
MVLVRRVKRVVPSAPYGVSTCENLYSDLNMQIDFVHLTVVFRGLDLWSSSISDETMTSNN